jgi:hypothetical protein
MSQLQPIQLCKSIVTTTTITFMAAIRTHISNLLGDLSHETKAPFRLDENGRCHFQGGDIAFVLDVPLASTQCILSCIVNKQSIDSWEPVALHHILSINLEHELMGGAAMGADPISHMLVVTYTFNAQFMDSLTFRNVLTNFALLAEKLIKRLHSPLISDSTNYTSHLMA